MGTGESPQFSFPVPVVGTFLSATLSSVWPVRLFFVILLVDSCIHRVLLISVVASLWFVFSLVLLVYL